jgi:acyl-CoA synthetase (AMP-forming)/AMP-acid ligase II
MTNIVEKLRSSDWDGKDSTAIATADTESTYEQFEERTDRFAAGPRDNDIEEGDPVAVDLAPGAERAIAVYGTL